jgi:ParB family chromosome partitioning protein
MSKEKRLGRGLAALLGEPAAPRVTGSTFADDPVSPPSASTRPLPGDPFQSPDEALPPAEASDRELLVRVEDIEVNPFQPRREFGQGEISSLAESLKEHDLLQPVLVRRHGAKWQLISGERRLRAAIEAGWTKIPARVKEADDRLVAELAIVENLQRKDLNPIEKALSFQRYLREHGSTQEELGKRLKIDRSTIANLMRLLELPQAVQAALGEGRITAGHARALLPLGDSHRQVAMCQQIAEAGLSVRETERMVQEASEGIDAGAPLQFESSPAGKKRRTRKGQISSMELELRRALGTKVTIQEGAAGRGKIMIHFKGNAEFERLRNYLMDGNYPDSEAV